MQKRKPKKYYNKQMINRHLYHLIRRLTWRTSRDFWTGQRAEIYVACRGICWFCGYPASMDDFTVDHIVPKSLGGSNELYNLWLVHERCHMRHHRNNWQRIDKLIERYNTR